MGRRKNYLDEFLPPDRDVDAIMAESARLRRAAMQAAKGEWLARWQPERDRKAMDELLVAMRPGELVTLRALKARFGGPKRSMPPPTLRSEVYFRREQHPAWLPNEMLKNQTVDRWLYGLTAEGVAERAKALDRLAAEWK